MKTYQDEKSFVENFAKDCKQGIKSNGNFEAEINGVNVVVSGMDNNNSSKVTVYTGTINGVSFSGSITALKKRLNVTYTKEYNRNAESSTKVTIKTDDELSKTAETAAKRIKDAVETISKYANKYLIDFDVLVNDGYMEELEDGTQKDVRAYDMILDYLKRERDNEAKRREDEAKKKAEESAKKLASEKEKLEKQLAELQAKLAKMQ